MIVRLKPKYEKMLRDIIDHAHAEGLREGGYLGENDYYYYDKSCLGNLEVADNLTYRDYWNLVTNGYFINKKFCDIVEEVVESLPEIILPLDKSLFEL